MQDRFSFGFACMIPLDSAEADCASETTAAENLSCGATDHKMLPPLQFCLPGCHFKGSF